VGRYLSGRHALISPPVAGPPYGHAGGLQPGEPHVDATLTNNNSIYLVERTKTLGTYSLIARSNRLVRSRHRLTPTPLPLSLRARNYAGKRTIRTRLG